MSPQSLPHPSHPDAPKYWRHETGGELRVAVENYLYNRLLTVRQLALLRAYLSQWIDSPVWDLNPSHDEHSRVELAALRLRARRISTVADIRSWIANALAEGHDPL